MVTLKSPGAAAIALLLAACATQATQAPAGQGAPAYRLYALDMRGEGAPISVLDGTTGRLIRTLPLGTPSPDWSRLYSLTHQQAKTTLRALDTHSGEVVSQISFSGWYDLPAADAIGRTGGLSQNGQWLVMAHSGEAGKTSFMLAATSFSQRPRMITMPGSFDFDAVSNDGKRLYLVESLAPKRPGYQVRLYNLDSGSLDPRVVVDKRETGPMTGNRVSGIFDRQGRWQYSLYTSQAGGPFIHALNLEGNLAWCIDLPPGGTQFEQMMWSLSLNANGKALIAVNPTLGKSARIDVGADGPSNEVNQNTVFTPVRSAPQAGGFFTEAYAKGIQVGSSALARDGRTLVAVADSGTIAIELPAMTPSRTLINDEAVESVVMSDDGAALFSSAWAGSTLRQLNPLSGAVSTTVHLTTTYLILHAERVK